MVCVCVWDVECVSFSPSLVRQVMGVVAVLCWMPAAHPSVGDDQTHPFLQPDLPHR